MVELWLWVCVFVVVGVGGLVVYCGDEYLLECVVWVGGCV